MPSPPHNHPSTLPTPTPDELDDLIYFSRTSDLSSLQALITNLCETHSVAPSVILASAIDIDAEGLGSQSCLLHYAAANGNLEIITYLISLITPSTTAAADKQLNGTHNILNSNGDTSLGGGQAVVGVVDKSAPDLINHKNINGNTPLHWAAMNGKLEVVKILVGKGADVTIRNEAGRDAVVEAELSSVEGAAGCVEWMLGNCEGVERGVGGVRAGEVEEEVNGGVEEGENAVTGTNGSSKEENIGP